MKYWTLSEIRRKVELEHDLLEETFISPEELNGYINESIDIVESTIVGMYEDYYLTSTDWIPVVEENTLPDNIYANKLRKVEVKTSNNGIIQLHKNRNLRNQHNDPFARTTKYNIMNRAGAMPVLVIDNIADLDITSIRYHYIRNANRLEKDDDKCDIPEIAMHYLMAFVKMRCYEKEKDPMTQKAQGDVEAYRNLMEQTLSNMVDDDSPLIEGDYSFYNDFDDNCFY